MMQRIEREKGFTLYHPAGCCTLYMKKGFSHDNKECSFPIVCSVHAFLCYYIGMRGVGRMQSINEIVLLLVRKSILFTGTHGCSWILKETKRYIPSSSPSSSMNKMSITVSKITMWATFYQYRWIPPAEFITSEWVLVQLFPCQLPVEASWAFALRKTWYDDDHYDDKHDVQ